MSYIDYDYYTDAYGGERIPSPSFPRYSRIASALADTLTGCQLTTEHIDDNVRDALCRAAEYYFSRDKHSNVKSENNDGYSVTYDDDQQVTAQEILMSALYSTGLLYRGTGI